MATKAYLETRKKMFASNMNDEEYLRTSYDRQQEQQRELRKIIPDPRKRVQ